jgi:hypothetical protein
MVGEQLEKMDARFVHAVECAIARGEERAIRARAGAQRRGQARGLTPRPAPLSALILRIGSLGQLLILGLAQLLDFLLKLLNARRLLFHEFEPGTQFHPSPCGWDRAASSFPCSRSRFRQNNGSCLDCDCPKVRVWVHLQSSPVTWN